MKSEENKRLVAKSENAAVEFKRARGGVPVFSRGDAEARRADAVVYRTGGQGQGWQVDCQESRALK